MNNQLTIIMKDTFDQFIIVGEVGLPVYKSMPFGPLEVVTSYLGRRAVENRGVLDKVKKERQLLNREFKHRYFQKYSKSTNQV